jgi:TolB-like protein/Flp pilus assembly protein TadD
MGEVFRAYDGKLNREVALKLLPRAYEFDPDRLARFRREAQALAALNHPHIAAIYGLEESGRRQALVLELVDGDTLAARIGKGPLPVVEALTLARQMADALQAAHEKGIVHRDLKPANIKVTPAGVVKVLDFGLAKAAAESAPTRTAASRPLPGETHVGVIVGTTAYMSPEQARGEDVDARTDIWGLGCVLFELLSGVKAFVGDADSDSIAKVLHGEPAWHRVPAKTPTRVQQLLRRCLQKDRNQRPSNMTEVRAVLEQQLASRTRADARAPLWVGAALAGLVIVAGALWFASSSRSTPEATGGTTPGRPLIAVVAFEMMSGSPENAWLGKGLPSMVVTGLAQTPDVEVVGIERLGDAARQIGAANLDAVDRAKFAELARRAGARFILNGTIVQAGSELRIDARVEDLSSGVVRFADSVRGADVLALADQLAARVREGLDVQTAPGAVRRVADVASGSTEAYRAYTAGLEAAANNRASEAIALFDQALAIDPDFGLAYFHKAGMLLFQGKINERRRVLDLAARHADGMPERDAMLVRVALTQDSGRTDEARRLAEALVERYPDTEFAWRILWNLVGAEDPLAAAALTGRAVAALPYSPLLRNMNGYSLLGVERTDEAIREFETYVKLRPAEPNALDSLAEGQLVAGRLSEALATYENAIKGGYNNSRASRAWTLAVIGRYSEALASPPEISTARFYLLSRVGRYRAFAADIEQVEQQVRQQGAVSWAAALQLVAAMVAIERQDCRASAAHVAAAEQAFAAEKAVEDTRPLRVALLSLAGHCDVLNRRLDAARLRLEEARTLHMAKWTPQKYWVAALEGEIALASRNYARAAQAFAAGEPARKMYFSFGSSITGLTVSFLANNFVSRDGLARVAIAQGRPAEAIAIYRALLTPGPQSKWTAILEPRYVLALARLLEKTGDREAARTEYQRFLDLWKDADAGLPELSEARARVAALAQ